MIPDLEKLDHVIHIDFESYYDTRTGYSLSKMPTINYVRDPRFKSLGVAVAVDDGPQQYMTHEDFTEWASHIDWSRVAVNAFNCAFDGTVLTQHYGIFPAYYICTLSVARALLPLPRYRLKDVAPALGLGEKGDALVDGGTEVTAELAEYACNDNELSRGIYKMLYPLINQMEKDLIHLTIRQWTEPTLVLDSDVLTQVMNDAAAERATKIAASGYSDMVLTSNQQFAKLIVEDLGLIPPTKISDATGEETEAFSKGDDEFVEFMLRYPEYSHVWEGRLAAKSNINIRRPEKFLSIAELGGTTPMPLHYWGAHTGRWSGGDGLNVQNLPNLYKSNMRLAFRAPKGYKVVVVDSAQIELRLNMWFCGQWDKLEILRNGGDLYREEAANQFQIAASEVVKGQRNFGKAVQLGCGYGMGGNKFRKYCAAGPLGLDPIYLTPSQSLTAISTYRQTNPAIPLMWRQLDDRINQMSMEGANEQLGVVTFIHNAIQLPSGRELSYFGLEQHESGSWVYGAGKKKSFLWGGTLLENIIQALARDVVAEQMLKIEERYQVVSSTHDEVIYLAREEEAQEAFDYGCAVFATPPSWAPDLPLGFDGGFDDMYSK